LLTITIEAHIKGLIFDSDGTLVDTMPLHYLAWQEIMQARGAHFPEPLFYELAGVPSHKIAQILNEKFGYQLPPQETAAEKEALFLSSFLPQAKPIEPVLAIARKYKGRLPMAVATGGIRPVVQAAIKAIGMTDFFDAVVSSEDVRHGKPAPDTFLEAARRLKVEPAACMVFEDSDLGLEAAKRAGMVGVDIRPWLAR
jgi:beta-phosphoglucomutase family hydrolase